MCVHLGGRVEHMDVNNDERVSREEFAQVCVSVYLYVCVFVCVIESERGCVCVCLEGRVEHMDVNNNERVSREEFALYACAHVCMCVCVSVSLCLCACVCV